MPTEVEIEPPTLTAKLLRREVKKAKQGGRRIPAPVGAKGMVGLSDDLRAVMYGLGALVAAVDGVTSKEARVLSAVADFLALSGPTRKHIDEAVREAPSTAVALDALFGAFRESQKSHNKRHSARRTRASDTGKVEHVRALAEEEIFSLPMLDAGEVSELLGSRSRNRRQYAATLRRRGALLGLPRGNRYVYPKFQFDPKTRRVYPVIETVGKVLDAGRDPWGAVSFWTSPHPRLRDRRAPMDLLGTPNASTELPSLAQSMVAPVG